MKTDELAAVVALVKGAGVVGLLALVVYASSRKWFVWAWQYDECCQRVCHAEALIDRMREEWNDSLRLSRRLQELHQSDDGC